MAFGWRTSDSNKLDTNTVRQTMNKTLVLIMRGTAFATMVDNIHVTIIYGDPEYEQGNDIQLINSS